MERICEFCAGLRPVIYCKPDAAHLCLSCDAKVHSANALSSRHLRTLLCDSCRNFPTHLQCLDHQMFLCRNCDRSLHDSSSQHQRRTIRGYMGCPSARDFAAIWGFKLNELDNPRDRFVLTSGSEASGIATLDSGSSHVSDAGHKTLYKGQEQGIFILQQILDLNRLQLVKGNNHSPFIGREGPSPMPSTYEKPDESPNLHQQHPKDLGADVQQRDHLLPELKIAPLPFSFSQLENLPQSSAMVFPLHGDSLWQCRSPAESSQLWSQNMQDLGVCDDLVLHDDFNIPEVDLTFQNFEDIFDGDQDPIRGGFDPKNESCSSMDNDMSLDKSDDHHGKAMEESSATSSTPIIPCALMDKDQVCNPPTSTTDSRLSFESADFECLDKRTVDEPSCSSPRHCHQEHEHSMAMRKHCERKQSQMQQEQNRPLYRKARSLVRKRVKRRYAKAEPYDSDIIVFSRSF